MHPVAARLVGHHGRAPIVRDRVGAPVAVVDVGDGLGGGAAFGGRGDGQGLAQGVVGKRAGLPCRVGGLQHPPRRVVAHRRPVQVPCAGVLHHLGQIPPGVPVVPRRYIIRRLAK